MITANATAGNETAAAIFLVFVAVLLFFVVRGFIRWLRLAYREVMDHVYIVRRGVLNPIQVRQEFVDTMGREPTIAEVHDLQEMIKTEHQQSVQWLVASAVGIASTFYAFYRIVRGKRD